MSAIISVENFDENIKTSIEIDTNRKSENPKEIIL